MEIKFESLNFSKSERGLLSYGAGLVSSRLLSGSLQSIDRFFVGITYSASTLGFYFYSKNLVQLPDQVLRTSITNPLLSYINKSSNADSYERLQSTASILAVFVMPILAFICVEGGVILPKLMGESWRSFGTAFETLGYYGLALVLKGWIGIFFINSMKMGLWNAITFTEAIVSVIVCTAAYVLKYDIDLFILLLSAISLAFWVSLFFILVLSRSQRSPIFVKKLLTDFDLILIPFSLILIWSLLGFLWPVESEAPLVLLVRFGVEGLVSASIIAIFYRYLLPEYFYDLIKQYRLVMAKGKH